MIRIRLVGCERYNFKGELYLKGKVYAVGENKAKIMLRDTDDYERPYFVPYVKMKNHKSAKQVAAELAAALAKAAAEEDEEEIEIVERPDGSEPQPVADGAVVEEVVEQPVEVDVDTDEADLDLDGEDETSSEEVDVDEDEDADRSDGSEVKV